jgi:hypothetical protein
MPLLWSASHTTADTLRVCNAGPPPINSRLLCTHYRVIHALTSNEQNVSHAICEKHYRNNRCTRTNSTDQGFKHTDIQSKANQAATFREPSSTNTTTITPCTAPFYYIVVDPNHKSKGELTIARGSHTLQRCHGDHNERESVQAPRVGVSFKAYLRKSNPNHTATIV